MFDVSFLTEPLAGLVCRDSKTKRHLTALHLKRTYICTLWFYTPNSFYPLDLMRLIFKDCIFRTSIFSSSLTGCPVFCLIFKKQTGIFGTNSYVHTAIRRDTGKTIHFKLWCLGVTSQPWRSLVSVWTAEWFLFLRLTANVKPTQYIYSLNSCCPLTKPMLLTN